MEAVDWYGFSDGTPLSLKEAGNYDADEDEEKGDKDNKEATRQNVRKLEKEANSVLVSALTQVLSPQYVILAFHLPPISITIWRRVEVDITSQDDAFSPPDGAEDLVRFLLPFFSPCLVDTVRHNLTCLANSFFGVEYTLRAGKGSLAIRALDDILHEQVYQREGPLAGFLGDASGTGQLLGDESSTGGGTRFPSRSGQRDDRNTHQGHPDKTPPAWRPPIYGGSTSNRGKGEGRGRGRERRGGGSRGGRLIIPAMEEHFKDLKLVEVLLPAYKTLSKVSNSARHDAFHARNDRSVSIEERSSLFHGHHLVAEAAPYNPNMEGSGNIHLFHGMRTNALYGNVGFKAKGINPKDRPNEFCAEAAFYVSNSVRHAFEHPLHHLSQNLQDPVSVLVFDVDVEVLHGYKPPQASDLPFDVLWFEEPDDEWERTCRGNMNKALPGLDFDIVIGPICKVMPHHQKCRAMDMELEGEAPLTQIAFCSKRSVEWLENHALLLYMEKRSSSV